MSRTRKHRADDNGRECSQCDVYKSWDEFSPGAGARGRDTRCKGCMRNKGKSRNAQPEVQEAERLRWIARWEAAHPGETYSRTRVWRVDECGRECSYDGDGNCGHVYKSWSAFNVNGRKRETRCRRCLNVRTLFTRFLITGAQLKQLEEAAVFSPGLCDVHGGPETMKYRRWGDGDVCALAIDHDHNCTQGHKSEQGCPHCIRGFVCRDCNRGVLRMAEKWPAIGARFADYLARRPLLSIPAPV